MPQLSSAAHSIAYLERTTDLAKTNIKVMDMNGTNKVTLPVKQTVTQIGFSTVGDWIYYVARDTADTTTDIWRIKPDGSGMNKIMEWPGSSEREIAISADGTLCAFISDRDTRLQIYLADAKGAAPLRFSDPQANHRKPLFSPDGQYVAYLSDRESFGGSFDLWLYDRITGKVSAVTKSSSVNDFCWLADSKTLLYSGGTTVSDLNTVNIVSGESRKFLPSESIKKYSELVPRSIMLGTSEKIIYVRTQPDGSRHIYWTATDGSSDMPLVKSIGNDWLE